MPTVFANLLSNFSVYGPAVSQNAWTASTPAKISSTPKTFPVMARKILQKQKSLTPQLHQVPRKKTKSLRYNLANRNTISTTFKGFTTWPAFLKLLI
jgi:hypothetical protein